MTRLGCTPVLTRVSISELSSCEKLKPTLLYSFCVCWRGRRERRERRERRRRKGGAEEEEEEGREKTEGERRREMEGERQREDGKAEGGTCN